MERKGGPFAPWHENKNTGFSKKKGRFWDEKRGLCKNMLENENKFKKGY